MKHAKTIWFSLFLVLVGFLSLNTTAQEAPKKPTREEVVAFLEEYRNAPLSEEEKKPDQSGRLRFANVDITARLGKDFTGLDLSFLDFELKTKIFTAPEADFSGCNMQGAEFDGAYLRDCRFVGTDLRNAMIRETQCENADFSNAILGETRFLFSEMRNVKFANLDATQKNDFSRINFSGSDLSHTNFSGSQFGYSCDFIGTDLTGANLSNLDLSGMNFFQANLKNATFAGSNLHKADFSEANIEGTDFTGASLYAAEFDDVQGLDASQVRALKSRSMKWFYELTVVLWNIGEVIFFPGFLACVLGVIVFSVCGVLWKEKSKLFITAIYWNAFALFSTLCTVLMLFSGGHAVRQMSGNMNIWSFWLNFWPVLALTTLGVFAASVVTFFVYVSILCMRKKIVRPWGTFFYLLLTMGHVFWTFSWLLMFVPDA